MGSWTRAGSRLVLAAGVALLACVSGPIPAADADVGSLTHRGCLHTGTSTSLCASLPGTALDALKDVVVSPDSRHVYGAADNAAAITTFTRDAAGGLSFAGCLSSNTDSAGCDLLPGAAPGGEGTPLAGANTLAVSPDGRSVYVTSQDEALIRFGRDPGTGTLSYVDCISGRSGSLCAHLPGSTSDANGTGLAGAREPLVNADGTNLYVAARGSDAISRFARDPQSGAISYLGCIGANTAAACSHIPGATIGGTGTGLNGLYEIVLSPDGRNLYAVASADDSVARFAVDPTGKLSYGGCLTSDSDVANCAELPGATAEGAKTAADRAMSLTIAPDGRQVYVAGRDDSIALFDRDAGSGALAYSGCVSGNLEMPGCTQIPSATADGKDSGLDGPRKIAVSGDGRDVYLAAEYESAILRFRRDTTSGALAFAGCHTGRPQSVACTSLPAPSASASGLQALESIAISPDGRGLYTASAISDSLSHFARETPPINALASAPPSEAGHAPSCTPPRLRQLKGLARGAAKRRPAVRLRAALSTPGQVKILRAKLILGAGKARRVVALRPASGRAAPLATLRLRLPAHTKAPRGTRVRVRAVLRTRGADKGCRLGPKRRIERRAWIV
ncbi:MAG: hypothetical protein WA862_04170 [Solirubrobacterales bacterium]